MALARGVPGTDRIFSSMSSSRSRLPVLLEPIKRSYRKSYGVRRRSRLRHSLCRTWSTRSARQVRAEAQPMADQESAASQEKGGGSREDRASVSFGSAGAGEEMVRGISEIFGFLSEVWGSCRLYR